MQSHYLAHLAHMLSPSDLMERLRDRAQAALGAAATSSRTEWGRERLIATLGAEQEAAAIVPSASSLTADLTSFLEHAIPHPLATSPA